MAKERNFSGVIAPVLTPLGEDGNPDAERFTEHAQWLMDTGCTALAPFGTTSEANSLGLDERMEMLEEITWPKPLDELLAQAYEVFASSQPWIRDFELSPKSVVREMFEQGMSFTDFVTRYQLARSEGLVLRYLTDAYRTLRVTVPESRRTPELEELGEWLGETIRQTDSSLLDEWEALSDPDHASSAVAHHEPPPPPRPLSKQERPFRVMVRNAMWARVDAVSTISPESMNTVRSETRAACCMLWVTMMIV